MARSSGIYALPAGNPVTTNTLISSSVQNNTLNDIASALTQSISQDGQTPITGNLPMSSFKHTNVAVASLATDYARADQVQNSSLMLLSAVSGTNTMTASVSSPNLAAYLVGQKFHFIATTTNTSAATLSINALAALPLVKASVALVAGDIVTGLAYEVIYDGTSLQIVGYASANLSNVISINGGQIAGFRNVVINGNLNINQRGVSGTVTLAAGIYGHDRFKAGAGGCTYTFATTNNVTTLTISAGTLQQVIEGINLQSGTYKLSWTGTAQGKVDAGAFGATGVTGTAVGGTNQTVEFNTGTLAKVQYEFGVTATAFETRSVGQELMLCQRYYEAGVGFGTQGYSTTATSITAYRAFSSVKRSLPTLVYSGTSYANSASIGTLGVSNDGFSTIATGTTAGGNSNFSTNFSASAEL